MSVYLDKIQKILNQYEGSEQKELIDYYIEKGKEKIFDEDEIKNTKILLLSDLYKIKKQDDLIQEAISHKALQIRALVLDLVDTDYSSNIKNIYKPDKWIKKIILDIEESFNFDNDFDKMLFEVYINKLDEEFCNIFLSESEKFGSSGNQLLLNLHFFKRFVNTKISYDFTELFKKVKNSFKEQNYFNEEKINEILDDYDTE